MDKFPQHVYMLNMKKSNVENFHYNILLYIYANIYNLGSFKPLFTLKIKGKITLAHNFIHLYNDKIFDIVVINIQSFKKTTKY